MKNSKFLSLCGTIALLIRGWFFATNNWNSACIDWNINCMESTNISITLYNSYSWSIQFNSGTNNRIMSGWNIWVGQQTGIINTRASESSSYILQWWLHNLTWAWSWSYSISQNYNLGAEWIHNLQAEFSKSWEYLFSNIITLYTDYSAPSTPIHTWMPNNTIFTSITGSLSRNNSVDTGVWLAWYYLYISMNPSFAWITPIRITGNNREFNTNDLPKWTIFYKTIAVDYLNHESSSVTSYFHNQLPTYQLNWWGSYTNQQIPNLQKTETDIGNNIVSYVHPTVYQYFPKRKIFNNQTKALKPYLIANFSDHSVANRVLPDTMPQTGVGEDSLEPITKDTIEEILWKNNNWVVIHWLYFYLFRWLIITICIMKRNEIIKTYKKYNKILDK